jgi:hypothetical protein
MSKRQIKKTKIILIYIVLFTILVSALYFIFKPDATCTDKKQNQREAGIDCGGPCGPCAVKLIPKDLSILKTEWIRDTENKFDAVVKIKNPNNLLGAERVVYEISLLDEQGSVIGKSGNLDDFVLPEEEKYLMAHGIQTSANPVDAKIEIKSIEWQKFSQYKEPRFSILRKNYQVSTGGSANFSQLKGALINKSEVDHETIKVKLLLRDENNKLLAANYQIMNTVRAEEEREFVISFPRSFPGEVVNIEIIPETNIFDSDNYIRIYGNPEVWEVE